MRLHYEDAGQGTAVVMLHGGGPGASGMSNFGPNLPAFAERFRTLVVDQPGYGKSDKPEIKGNYVTFAADALAALLDELGIGRVHAINDPERALSAFGRGELGLDVPPDAMV